jgi:hypothetical protein
MQEWIVTIEYSTGTGTAVVYAKVLRTYVARKILVAFYRSLDVVVYGKYARASVRNRNPSSFDPFDIRSEVRHYCIGTTFETLETVQVVSSTMAFRRRSSMTCLSLTILCQALFLGKAFTVPDLHGRPNRDLKHDFSPPRALQLSASSPQVGASTESTENVSSRCLLLLLLLFCCFRYYPTCVSCCCV